MLTKIHVDRECINNGVSADPLSCPVALAIQNVVKPEIEVFVDYGENGIILTKDPTDCQRYSVPQVNEFIDKFDVIFERELCEEDEEKLRDALAEFEFELDIPEHYLVTQETLV